MNNQFEAVWNRWWLTYVVLLMSTAEAYDGRKGWSLTLMAISMFLLIYNKIKTSEEHSR